MRELVRTNDPILISFVEALLGEAGVAHLVLDGHMSMLEGSLSVLPRRIVVPDEDLAQARRLLTENGLAAELAPDAR